MIVAFQFGWGLEIDVEKLKEINESRHGKDYFDTTAATAVNGNTKKAELTESPFLVTFEYGGDRGYWTGNHMILQVEDCIDCLRVLNNDRYRYAFLFDHSSGYRRYPLASKKGKEHFVDLVSKCTSRAVLTTDLIRKFSRRARSYMLTYKSLEIVGEGSKDQDDKKSNDITHKHIENTQKLFRTHRAALDFDKGFIVA